MPRDLGPLVFTFTGDGNVTRGALHMFSCLPNEMVAAKDLQSLVSSTSFAANKVYGCQVSLDDYIIRKSDQSPLERMDRDEYYSNPELFGKRRLTRESTFHKTVAPYTTMLVNGILWDPRYPRLLTKEQMKQGAGKRMHTIADISCDIGGSLEFMSKAVLSSLYRQA